MEKIVVMSGGTEHDSNLIECLRVLFPECEIDIQDRMPKDYDSFELFQDESEAAEPNEEMDKYLAFL